MCLFVPNLLLSTGIIASHLVQSPKEDFIDMLSMDCPIHLIPLLWSYSFNNLIHNFLKMPNWTYFWNRLWQVEADLYSEGSSIFHWQPVLRTYRIAFIIFLYGTIGRSSVLFGFSVGNVELWHSIDYLKYL